MEGSVGQGFSSNVENVPGYDMVMDSWNEFAEEKLQTKDPFYEQVDGEEVRRKPPPGISKEQRRVWKRVIDKAWTHDRSFCGCYWADIGMGIAPLAALIPVIGPIMMYVVHGRIVTLAEQVRIPSSMHAKMTANITFDFLVSLVPIIGAFFAFMNQCSTRNAAMLDSFLRAKGEQQLHQMGPFERVEQTSHQPRNVGRQMTGEVV